MTRALPILIAVVIVSFLALVPTQTIAISIPFANASTNAAEHVLTDEASTNGVVANDAAAGTTTGILAGERPGQGSGLPRRITASESAMLLLMGLVLLGASRFARRPHRSNH